MKYLTPKYDQYGNPIGQSSSCKRELQIGSCVEIVTYIGPKPDCKVLKKFMCLTTTYECPTFFWIYDEHYYPCLPITKEELMSGYTKVSVNNPDTNGTATAQVVDFKLQGVFSGTVEDIIALAIADVGPILTDEAATPATVEMICEYDYIALPCGGTCLEDPTDPTTAVPVDVESTFVGGIKVLAGGDPKKGGVTLDRPVVQEDGAISNWCFTFTAETDKNNELI